MTLSNKDANSDETAVISLTGSDKNYQSAVVYAITQDSSEIKVIDVQNDLSGNTLTVTLPALSVAQIVISDQKSDAEITEEPDVTIKETVYNYADLELSENNYPILPLGDKEHLKEIVFNVTAGALGGGGLCFNQVVPEGETAAVWGSKAISFDAGTNDNIVKFNDKFTIVVDEKGVEVSGTTLDDYAEIQPNWWTYPEGAEVTYNTIKLVYEYDNNEQPSETETESETESGTETSVLLGDANTDGKVDILDVITINKALLGKETLTPDGLTNSDLNKNQKPDSDESLAILKFIVGLLTKEDLANF